ncbi:MAG TPA: YwiC-like family protein [Trueperaceae bacterium]
MAVTAKRPSVPLKTVALPNEHGAWAFLLEPALLGLLLAPSLAGASLGVAALGALLTQHPLSLVLADRRRGKTYPRTGLALRFVLFYAPVAGAALLTAVLLRGEVAFLFPALVVAPLALVQLVLDARNRGRSLGAELCGASAVSALAPTILLAGGSELVPAMAIWLLLLARNLSSILYVRARLRLEYDRPAGLTVPVAAQFGALMVVTAPVVTGVLPYAALMAIVVLAVRALLGLSKYRRATQPKYVGMRELAFGLLLVALTAAGTVFG